MTWYVVAHNIDNKDSAWTLSKNPNVRGWSGHPGYGLSKEDAIFLATAANEKIARDVIENHRTVYPPHTYSYQYGKPCVTPKPEATADEVISYARLIGAVFEVAYEEAVRKFMFVVTLRPEVGPELWSEEALRRSLPKKEENMSSLEGFSFKKLDREMVHAPGLVSSEDLRIAATELKEFLGLFRVVEKILEITPISENVLMSHIRTLEQTAKLVEERNR